jgi:hypothetical protein
VLGGLCGALLAAKVLLQASKRNGLAAAVANVSCRIDQIHLYRITAAMIYKAKLNVYLCRASLVVKKAPL